VSLLAQHFAAHRIARSRDREPASVSVSPRRMRGAILDAMWFLWAFALWEFIEELHTLKLLPTLF
jgi:hypothetical protein